MFIKLFIYIIYLFFIIQLSLICVAEESFYDILGVSNNADTKTIRKAFKKIAILKHPDKNPDDPNAHSVFIRINRAYEVLKDDELRKKYDEYGEAGLDPNFSANQKYQSWQFYKDNFGIYDDDAEIVTLSRTDFEEEVIDSNDFWFINFYSTFCSHCHKLAPIWRKFAKELDGIIRIGAVNCAEDPMLCQSQHVRAYPSLLVYPQHISYQGHRDIESLKNYIFSQITTPIHSITSIEDVNRISQHNTLPFFIEYCGIELDYCLNEIERIKIASMLAEIANFGFVDCAYESKEFCSKFMTSGFAFYPFNYFDKNHEKEIIFADLKELYLNILYEIESIEHITSKKLMSLINTNLSSKKGINSIVIFFENFNEIQDQLEYKKLYFNFPNLKIYFADCSKLGSECYQHLHLKNLPKVILFRSTGGYDIHYSNKISVREVKKFINKSLMSSLISLNNKNYDEIFKEANDDIILIDYFAPWCPPCQRLIPELRKLPFAIEEKQLRLATLDCDAYKKVCQNLNINSFPTSILYIKDSTFKMVGYHDMLSVVEFIEESINPSVLALDYDSFKKQVINRNIGRLVLVDFFAPWCGPCQQLAPEFRKLARLFNKSSEKILFVTVDCDANKAICDENDIRSYPSIRLYDADQSSKPKSYPPNWWRDHKSMQHWLNEQLPSLVERITGEFYSTILGSKQPIFVDYYAPWCGHCVKFAPVLEEIAKLLEGEVRVAKVNCDLTPHLCEIASVQAYPSLRLYFGTAIQSNQNSYGIQIRSSHDPEVIVQTIYDILQKNGHKIRDEL